MENEPQPLPRPTPPPDLAGGPPPSPIPSSQPPPPPSAMMGPPPGAAKVEKTPVRRDSDEEEEPEPGSEAPFNSRVLGGVIDTVVCMALNFGCILILPDMLEFIGGVLATAYFLTRDALPFLQGQSIGKKAMRIKAVTLDGKSLAGNWQAGILRNVFLLIWPVELFILWNRNEKGGSLRRLGDDYAKTKVIVVGEEEASAGESKPAE